MRHLFYLFTLCALLLVACTAVTQPHAALPHPTAEINFGIRSRAPAPASFPRCPAPPHRRNQFRHTLA
ncbi:MAG: hypothetical protein ACUVSY_15740, partial [Roseiflexus sp.]